MNISRKDFLKLMGLTAGVIAATPFIGPLKTVNALKGRPSSHPDINMLDLSIKWWQWVKSFSKKDSPIFDETGEKIQQNQPKPSPIFFLTGAYENEKYTRTVTIPSSKAIFFPVLNVEWSFAELPHIMTVEGLRQLVKEDIDTAKEVICTLDKETVNPVRVATTEPFYFYDKEGNTNTMTQAHLDGHWVYLNPLPKGKHEIYIKGTNNYIIEGFYRSEVMYKVDVV